MLLRRRVTCELCICQCILSRERARHDTHFLCIVTIVGFRDVFLFVLRLLNSEVEIPILDLVLSFAAC